MIEKNSKKIYVVLFIFAVIIFYNLVDRYDYKKLVNEVNKLSDKRIENKFEKKFVVGSKYRVVERAIKNYLYEYSNLYKKTNNFIDLNKYINLDSYDKLKLDTNLQEVINSKSRFNDNVSLLIRMSNDKYIHDYIYKYTSNKKLIGLYKDLMIDKNSDISSNIFIIEKNRDKYNNIYDSVISLYEFLINNKDNYIIVDNSIKFNSSSLLNEYDKHINVIKNIK